MALESGDTEQARDYFQKVIECRQSHEEGDLRDFFTSQSREALKALDDKSGSGKERGVVGRDATASRFVCDR